MENKYIKYKNKYIALKQQLGGNWSCSYCTFSNHDSLNICEICNMSKEPKESKDLFVIYTTGLAYENYIKFFYETLLDKVLPIITQKYRNIVIKNYDPLFKNVPKLNTLRKKYSNTYSSEFYELPFDNKQLANNYIIFDFAHIYYYNKDKTVFYSEEPEPKTKLNMTSLYFGLFDNYDIKDDDIVIRDKNNISHLWIFKFLKNRLFKFKCFPVIPAKAGISKRIFLI
jgi:hypothetical protein